MFEDGACSIDRTLFATFHSHFGNLRLKHCKQSLSITAIVLDLSIASYSSSAVA